MSEKNQHGLKGKPSNRWANHAIKKDCSITITIEREKRNQWHDHAKTKGVKLASMITELVDADIKKDKI